VRREKPHKGRSKTAPLPRKNALDIFWIRPLAAPYLRGYRPTAVRRGPLRGYRFAAPPNGGTKSRAGFFVGYLVDPEHHEFLKPAAPECIVFAFLEPVGSAFHDAMVAQEGSLLRKTTEYIGWLTHRPPRFAFFDDREIALARHFSMQGWPVAKRRHFSRNFFIETLAWLVRSGLVSRLHAGSTRLEGKRL
jgi:hypothetical protein